MHSLYLRKCIFFCKSFGEQFSTLVILQKWYFIIVLKVKSVYLGIFNKILKSHFKMPSLQLRQGKILKENHIIFVSNERWKIPFIMVLYNNLASIKYTIMLGNLSCKSITHSTKKYLYNYSMLVYKIEMIF